MLSPVLDYDDRRPMETSSRLVPLPPVGRSRVLIWAATPRDRYLVARHFPASRSAARLVKALCRAYAPVGVPSQPLPDLLKCETVGHRIRTAVRMAVLMDNSNRGRLVVIAEYRDGRGVCIKIADMPFDARLAREAAMMRALPDEISPRLIACQPDIGNRSVIVTELVQGAWSKRSLIPNRTAAKALLATASVQLYRAEDHPWIRSLLDSDRSGAANAFVGRLRGLSFPTVVAHGDFAPWNVIETADGGIRLIDWESGTLDGFPFVDEAHWVLQVAGLVKRYSAQRCIDGFLAVTEHWSVAGRALRAHERLAILGLSALHDSLECEEQHARLAALRSEVVARCG